MPPGLDTGPGLVPTQALAHGRPEGQILDPVDRNSEVLFGLFMVLTFTGTLSVATAGREDVRTMLITALGCNIAWGFVDGVMYVLRNMVIRGRQAKLQLEVAAAALPEEAYRLIKDELGPLAAGLGKTELDSLRRWIVARHLPARIEARPTLRDFKGALGVFLLVFGSTIPVVLPFLFTADVRQAMRWSAAIAIAMMYFCGYAWGRYAGLVPWRSGLVMMVLGCAVESVVIAFGG